MKRTLLLGATVLLAACTSTTAPTAEEFGFEFQAEALRDREAPAVVVTGGVGKITVQGGLRTGCLGHTLSGEALQTVPITFRVIANAHNPTGGCARVIEHFAYRSTLRNLAPGAHQVRVLHIFKRWDGDPNPQVQEVVATTVQVQ